MVEDSIKVLVTLVLLMFEDFTKENGATKYVRKSHLLRSIPPKNQKKYKYKLITGKRVQW